METISNYFNSQIPTLDLSPTAPIIFFSAFSILNLKRCDLWESSNKGCEGGKFERSKKSLFLFMIPYRSSVRHRKRNESVSVISKSISGNSFTKKSYQNLYMILFDAKKNDNDALHNRKSQ